MFSFGMFLLVFVRKECAVDIIIVKLSLGNVCVCVLTIHFTHIYYTLHKYLLCKYIKFDFLLITILSTFITPKITSRVNI